MKILDAQLTDSKAGQSAGTSLEAHTCDRAVDTNASSSSAGVPGLARIMDMLFDGILVVRDEVVVEANQGFLRMTGYGLGEILGRHINDLKGWDELALNLAAVPEGETTSFEALIPRKRSLPVSATVRAARYFHGDSFALFAVIAGMTENEPASATLLRSAERYRAIFESVQDLIFIKGKDLRFSDVNPAMANAFGLKPEEMIGRTAEQIYGADAGARIREWNMRVLAGESIEDEHSVVIKGQRLIFHDIRVPVRDTAGNIVGICGISRNVTEQRTPAQRSVIYSGHYRSKAMVSTVRLASQAAAKDSIVLLQGESGSGKDYLAKWIHEHSKRSGGRFITINCANLPHDLAESELFGHEAGAFTGAISKKRGLLELAEGGTILLNEIGELSPSLQSKLLVFLDSRSFHRIGGEKTVRVDARILVATHRNLEEEVALGRFSKALFYRLSVFPIVVPPLRERIDDIPVLAQELISLIATEMNLLATPRLHRESLKKLTLYEWPGNVRELRNVLEKGLILWQSGRLSLDVPFSQTRNQDLQINIDLVPGHSMHDLIRDVSKRICNEAIKNHSGNRSQAARSLGISRDSLYRYIRDELPDNRLL